MIYIFNATKELYASDSQANDFGKLQIEASGGIGDFSIVSKDRRKQLNLAYQSNLWSVCKFVSRAC